jgi:hypothetical protein
MTLFTIDQENSITAFATAAEANAACTTPFDLFTNQKELAELLAGWPAERLLATYNSLPGVKPVKALKDAKTAASKIWDRVEKLGQMVAPEPAAAKPEVAPAKAQAAGKAKAGARAAKAAPKRKKAGKEPVAKVARKSKESGEPKAARAGSKSEEVIAMLKRKNGATMAEIMLGFRLSRQEDGHRGGVLQIRQGRAHLPDQQLRRAIAKGTHDHDKHRPR